MEQVLIREIAESAPSLVFCERFNGMSSLWNYGRHKHPYLELIYRKGASGKTILSETGEVQRFSAFYTMVYPAQCWHEDQFPPSAENEAYCFWIDLGGLTFPKPLQICDVEGGFEQLFQQIYDGYHTLGRDETLLSLLLRALLVKVILTGDTKPPSVIDAVLQYVNEHYQEQMTIDNLAGRFFVSRAYLTRAIRGATGKTFVDYVNSLRIEAAKRLLITTNQKIDDVAEIVGFRSPKYFYRVFKQYTGRTPAAFFRESRRTRI